MDDRPETPDSPHRRAWDLIPWVVAGSAGEAERHLVAEHAAGCADCRDELAFHRSLRAGMLADAPVPRDAGPALQRLWARIDQAEAPPAPAPDVPLWVPPRVAGQRGGAARWLGVLVVVQAIGLAALAGRLWERPGAADYQTLSRAAPAPPRASIRLVADAGLRLGELKALLDRAGLQIVESSGDGAILGLAPRPGATASPDESLARLRAEPGVLLAEPIVDAAAARP